MSLDYLGDIELPAHRQEGGFDHAAVHRRRRRLYVAHTANDAIDVIDCVTRAYLRSVAGLSRVAGALVSEHDDLVFTSNRGENTIGIFAPDGEDALAKVTVGLGPNGLAYDPARRLLLAANVGDPSKPGSTTASIVDVVSRAMRADIPVPGRTRWAIFDDASDAFYVNIADPPQIVVVESHHPQRVARALPVPAAGPHGLDLDASTRRLFCACDGKVLVALDCTSGEVLAEAKLSGVPDVIFFNAERQHVYVAVGDPGLIEVFETSRLDCVEQVPTERGAHTLGFDPVDNTVYAFLPETHRARIYADQP